MHTSGPYIPSPDEILQLRQICTPLASSDATHEEHHDFATLNGIFATATVIGLGEQTHGTSEFFQMKHRLLNFLVTTMGFRLFAIKANMGTCQAINEYIHTGTGKLKSLMKKFYCGTSQEVFDVIEWMRHYNTKATTGQKINFAGFDFQDPAPIRLILEKYFMHLGDTGAAHLIEEIFTSYNTIKKIVESQILSDDQLSDIQQSSQYQQLLSNIAFLNTHISKHERKLDPDKFVWLQQNVKLIHQSAVYLLDFDMRHHAMLENIQWLQKQYDNAKTILWAHNFHLQKRDEQLGLGQLLAEALGEKYATVGFATYAGTYSAYSKNKKLPLDVKIPKPTADSLEANLHRLAMPIALVSFKDETKIPLFLKQPIPVHVLTTIAETHSFRPQKVAEAYDAIIFIANTHAAKQMPAKAANQADFAASDKKIKRER